MTKTAEKSKVMLSITIREPIRDGYSCSTQTDGVGVPGGPSVVVPAHDKVATLSMIAANGTHKRLIAGCRLPGPPAVEACKRRDAIAANSTTLAMSAGRKKSAGEATRRNA